MLKLYPLYSGSSGNMYLIRSPKATVIVDIGVSFKSLTESLDTLGISISEIDALFITHEHIDHTKGVATLLDKHKDKLKKEPVFVSVKQNNEFYLKDIKVTPFRISHDAKEPLGFTFANEESILTIATDLGYVSDDVYKQLSDSTFTVLECNYDRNLLMYGPYSYPLKCRIQSDIGHLSNDDTSDTILCLAKEGKRNFLLGHISENNNEPEQALFAVNQALRENGFDLNEFNINCATRDVSYEEYIL